jgi:hypothetical protein
MEEEEGIAMTQKVLSNFWAKPASQQNEERLIKAISIIKTTGKCEKEPRYLMLAW